MADVDVVRTVFKTEWLGANVVSNMIRQFGLAEGAIGKLGGKNAAAETATKSWQKMSTAVNDIKFDRLAHEVADGSKSMTLASMEANKLTESLGETTVASGSFISKLSPMTIALGAVALAVGAAVIAFKTLYPILEQGAEIAQLDSSFDHLIGTMTEYPEVLNDMKEASQFTVSNMAAQEGIMTLVAGSSSEMTSALAEAAPKLLEISKAANKLNPMLGDTNFMFTSLAKGVKRAEPRLIDNLGLKLRVSDANRTLAAELGKSVMALTAEEKQLAILNETLRAGDQLINQVGGSVEGMGDHFQRVTASQQDFSTALKQNIFLLANVAAATELYSGGLRGMATVLNIENDIIKAYNDGLIDKAQFEKFMNDNLERNTEATKENMIYLDRSRKGIIAADDAMQSYTQSLIDNANAQFGTFSEGDRFRGVLGGPMTNDDQRQRHILKDSLLERAQIQREMRDNLRAFTEERADLLAKDLDAAEKWADGINKASQEAQDNWKAYLASLGEVAIGHFNAERETSFFTTAIENLGDGFRVVGGATGDQADEMDRLEKKLASSRTRLSDMEMGLGQFGRKEEAIAKSTGKLVADIAILEGALESMGAVETEVIAVHQEAIWNWDNITKAITKSAEAAGIGAVDFAKYSQSIGEMTDQQAIATLQATALSTGIDKIWERVIDGDLPAGKVKTLVQNLAARISAQPFELLIEPEIKVPERVSARERMQEMMSDEAGGYFVQMQAEVDTQTASEKLIEEFFGEEALQPMILEATADLTEAEDAVEIFLEQDRVIIFSGVFEPGDLPAALPTDSGRIGGRAGGGNVPSGRAVVVGEQGPELIVPGSNSTVTPNNQLGGPPQINLTVSVGGSIGMDDFMTIVEDGLLEAMQQVGL